MRAVEHRAGKGARLMRIYWTQPPSRIGISERPRGGDWLSDDVRSWQEAGVDLVVSLVVPEEARELGLDSEEAECRAHGIAFRSFPIPDRGIPTRQTAALDLARSLASEAEDGKRVVVHCRQGIGRSAIVAAATLVALGRRPDEAIVEVERARGRPVPDTEEQRDWVLALRPGQPPSGCGSESRSPSVGSVVARRNPP